MIPNVSLDSSNSTNFRCIFCLENRWSVPMSRRGRCFVHGFRREANLSKAEKALQHGCSDPNRLNIPKVSDGEGISLAFAAFFV